MLSASCSSKSLPALRATCTAPAKSVLSHCVSALPVQEPTSPWLRGVAFEVQCVVMSRGLIFLSRNLKFHDLSSCSTCRPNRGSLLSYLITEICALFFTYCPIDARSNWLPFCCAFGSGCAPAPFNSLPICDPNRSGGAAACAIFPASSIALSKSACVSSQPNRSLSCAYNHSTTGIVLGA